MMDTHPTDFMLVDQVLNELKSVMHKIETLKEDLERMTAQRNQLEGEMKDMQESMRKEIAVRDAEREKLREDLRRETGERKATVDLLLNSFSEIHNLMNAAKHNISVSDGREQ